MNILVTGANGQLGMELRRAAKGSSDRYLFSDISEMSGVETICLDVTNKPAVELIANSENIDVFVNCAAFTNVDKAEDDIVLADMLNHTAAQILSEVALKRGSTLIHVSTDYVFSGRQYSSPFKETDLPEPCNVYGSTKLAGEGAIINSGCNYIIIRTAWLYSKYGRNFVKTILSMLRGTKDCRVVFDSVGTPTFAADLADSIVKIIESGDMAQKSVYHFSDEGVASWYDFAQAIREIALKKGILTQAAKVVPIVNSEYPTKARRPSFTVLDKSLIKKTFALDIPYWRDSLEKMLSDYENN